MLVRILSNLKGRADSQSASAQFSWNAISNMLQNLGGSALNYDIFKSEFDTNPQFKELVKRFDAQGVVLNTEKELPKPGQGGDKDAALANVKSSAKRAASKMVG
jgi:hypothetical protein